MKIKRILKILRMSQEELKSYVTLILDNYYKDIIATEEYVYAKGDIPVLLVAHLDIVHKTLPELILTDAPQGLMWSPTGIGGDDRCGVVAILDIIKKYRPYILFTTDEEIGALGAEKFAKDIKSLPVKFAIEIDRRGNNQAVFYECANQTFQDYILSYGFDLQYGTFTDICEISPEFDIASVNFSAGYFKEHTKEEYISLAALQNTIDKICKILDEVDAQPYYNYQKKKYNYPAGRWCNSIYDYDYEKEYFGNDYYNYDDDDDEYYYDSKLGTYRLKQSKKDKSKDKTKDKTLYELTDEEWDEYIKELNAKAKK